MSFVKYQHIERFGTDEVEGIEIGRCYVFPKIDGSNGSVWWEDGEIKTGSRRRELGEVDNQGFNEYIQGHEGIKELLYSNPELRLYGEWLVPHTLKTYRDDAWNRFYVFDVVDENGYMPYESYVHILEAHGVDCIPLQSVIHNGDYDTFIKELEKNTFLIQDGKGVGEGIVVKNYDFINKYGRQTWAKIVRSEFKEQHGRVMGVPTFSKSLVEEDIAQQYCTRAIVDKVYEKVVELEGGWRSEYIPRLLDTVYYEIITEDTWHFLKKFNFPTINFKTLKSFVIGQIKTHRSDLF